MLGENHFHENVFLTASTCSFQAVHAVWCVRLYAITGLWSWIWLYLWLFLWKNKNIYINNKFRRKNITQNTQGQGQGTADHFRKVSAVHEIPSHYKKKIGVVVNSVGGLYFKGSPRTGVRVSALSNQADKWYPTTSYDPLSRSYSSATPDAVSGRRTFFGMLPALEGHFKGLSHSQGYSLGLREQEREVQSKQFNRNTIRAPVYLLYLFCPL